MKDCPVMILCFPHLQTLIGLCPYSVEVSVVFTGSRHHHRLLFDVLPRSGTYVRLLDGGTEHRHVEIIYVAVEATGEAIRTRNHCIKLLRTMASMLTRSHPI